MYSQKQQVSNSFLNWNNLAVSFKSFSDQEDPVQVGKVGCTQNTECEDGEFCCNYIGNGFCCRNGLQCCFDSGDLLTYCDDKC